MLFSKARQEIVEAARRMAAAGMNQGTSGNFSLRTEDARVIAITPSSLPYEDMTAEDVCLLRLDGTQAEPGHPASSESPLHLALYRARADVHAVVHTHALYSTVWSLRGGELPALTVPFSEFAPVYTAPFVLPGTEELAEITVKTLGDGRAVLMEHHGLICVGSTLEKAVSAAEYVEENARIACYAALLDCCRPLPPEAVAAMAEKLHAGGAV